MKDVPLPERHATTTDPLRVGIGGPVGSGKTTLTARLCEALRDTLSVGVVTNDIYTREDADALVRMQALQSSRIEGVETGGCPIRRFARMPRSICAPSSVCASGTKISTWC